MAEEYADMTEISWTDARATAHQLKKAWRTFEKIFEACDKAVKAEEYMKQAHKEVRTLDEDVKVKRQNLNELIAEIDDRQNTAYVKMQELEADVQRKRDEIKEEIRDVQSKATESKHRYEQEIKEYERKLATESQRRTASLEEEMKPKYEQAQQELAKWNAQISKSQDELKQLHREKDRIAGVISKLKESVATVGV